MARITVQTRYTIRLSDEELGAVVQALDAAGTPEAQALLGDLGFGAGESEEREAAPDPAPAPAPRRLMLAWRRRASGEG